MGVLMVGEKIKIGNGDGVVYTLDTDIRQVNKNLAVYLSATEDAKQNLIFRAKENGVNTYKLLSSVSETIKLESMKSFGGYAILTKVSDGNNGWLILTKDSSFAKDYNKGLYLSSAMKQLSLGKSTPVDTVYTLGEQVNTENMTPVYEKYMLPSAKNVVENNPAVETKVAEPIVKDSSDTNTKSGEVLDNKPPAEGESFANLENNKDYTGTNLWINLLGDAARVQVQDHVNAFARNTFS